MTVLLCKKVFGEDAKKPLPLFDNPDTLGDGEIEGSRTKVYEFESNERDSYKGKPTPYGKTLIGIHKYSVEGRLVMAFVVAS
jgi:hypothetical protein